MSKLGVNKRKAIYLGTAILLIVLTYFFVYQRNMEQISEMEESNRKLGNQINYLQGLQPLVEKMEKESDSKVKEVNQFVSSFAPKLTQEKALYHIYKMTVATGVKVTSIEVGNSVVFYNDAKLTQETEAAKENAAGQDNGSESGETSAVASEQKPLDKMKGTMIVYTVGITGSQKKCMKALDWIAGNKEKMAVGATSLAYDSSTGELSGTIDINFFAMEGNGVKYEEPNLSGIQFGVDNIFGTKK